ncbi:hypothetical protein [Spirosoma arboris]|nr:hypothetical protein [Spirosoma arboris]
MANNQNKKVATKTPKVHGAPKVPKYEQRESASTLDSLPAKSPSKGKK